MQTSSPQWGGKIFCTSLIGSWASTSPLCWPRNVANVPYGTFAPTLQVGRLVQRGMLPSPCHIPDQIRLAQGGQHSRLGRAGAGQREGRKERKMRGWQAVGGLAQGRDWDQPLALKLNPNLCPQCDWSSMGHSDLHY